MSDGHHIWCNFFRLPAEGCKQCAHLKAKYPEDRPPDEMMAKHFPSVIIRDKPLTRKPGQANIQNNQGVAMMDDIQTLLRTAAEWIEKVAAEKACLPPFPTDRISNTAAATPTPEEFVARLRWKANRLEHPSYIDVYRAVNGWQTKYMTWDDEGFYDVMQTGFGPYGHELEGYKKAVTEGRTWAEDENVGFREPPPFEPLKPGEPSNIVEAVAKICERTGVGGETFSWR